jgi:ABC-type nitrate/sulfonate/bicarbonate transport system ATPase subunit
LNCQHLSDVKERMADMLQLMNLWERRKDRVRTVSGGLKRRLALTRTLLILAGFAAISLVVGLGLAARQLRRLG